MELPRPVEREMAQQPAAKDKAPKPAGDEVAPVFVAVPEPGLEDRSVAARSEKGGSPELKKKLAAEAPGSMPPPEAVPAAAPVERELPRQADKSEPIRYSEMEEGVIGGVPGDVGAQTEKDSSGEMKAAFAQKAMPRPAGSKASMTAARRSRSATGLNAASGALQIFLATSGRAAAPLNLGIVELAVGPFVRIEGDVAGDDLLVPGIQAVREWLPEGSALEVTLGADGRVTAVELLGEWESSAAVRAKKAAGKMIFSPAQQEIRRAILFRNLLTQ